MSDDFQVIGRKPKALFTLKIHRGDGMALVAMNWKSGKPPKEFVGFAIEYKEPGGDRFFTLKNRISFRAADGSVNEESTPTLLAPIQKFRWVHFPRNADLPGDFLYRVTPVFMNPFDELSYGEPQEAALELRRETYPGKLNVTFTRGFVSSQRPSRSSYRPTLTRGCASSRPMRRRTRRCGGWGSRRARRSSTCSTRRSPTTRRRSGSSPTS